MELEVEGEPDYEGFFLSDFAPSRPLSSLKPIDVVPVIACVAAVYGQYKELDLDSFCAAFRKNDDQFVGPNLDLFLDASPMPLPSSFLSSLIPQASSPSPSSSSILHSSRGHPQTPGAQPAPLSRSSARPPSSSV